MAEIHESEREQLEALKRWWSENGKTVMVGLILGIGAVFGWTAWQDHQRSQAEAASTLYQSQVDAMSALAYEEADANGSRIVSDYADSGYAPMAALLLAKSAFERDKPDAARRHLRWVLDHAQRPEFILVARLRLAKIALSSGNHDEALALLSVTDTGAFKSAFDELRGDIFVAESRRPEARTAYDSALAAMAQTSPLRQRVQLKLDELGQLAVPEQ